MRYEEFLKQLQTLRHIAPSENYQEKSLRLILASAQDNPQEKSWNALLIKVGTIGAMVAVALLVVSNSSIPLKVAGLDTYDLRAEAQALEVNIELAEIKESSLQSKQINLALEESAKNDPGHLNTTILKREADTFGIEEYHNESIDGALLEISD